MGRRGDIVIYPKPPVVTRTEWGCPDGQDTSHGNPEYTTVTHLILHHTATQNDATDWAAELRAIWNLHVFTNSWKDIGYNYLIDPNGVIYEGRAGGDDVLGAHFICANLNTMGTALLGNLSETPPTRRALASLVRLLAWKCSERGIEPLGVAFHPASGLELDNIAGHRDGMGARSDCGACPTETECPGKLFYAVIPMIRLRVKAELA
jgi:hypothetical protein